MNADNGDGHSPPPRFEGFQAYADDSPRRDQDDTAYASAEADGPDEDDPQRREGWQDDASYEEVAGSAHASPEDDWRHEDAPRHRARWPFGKLLAATGVALAFAGGLWLGRTLPEPAIRPVSEVATAASPAQMDVEVAQVAPLAPPPDSRAPLEVLPPDVTTALAPTGRAADIATAAPEIQPPGKAAVARPETLALPPPPNAAPQRVDPQGIAPPPPAPREVAAGPPPRTSYDCRDAPTRARAMVCADPRLAALDQQLQRAYDAALAAGFPEADLRGDQADWLDIREDAARYSRNAVAEIYRQRIEELRTMVGSRTDRP